MGMAGFYWLIEGELAGCPCPGLRGPEQTRARGPHGMREGDPDLDDDLAWLREQGVGAILTLTETALPVEPLARHGLAALHLAVRDMTAPSPEQLDRALSFIDYQRALGRAVAVHCRMGQGRTGTVLAAHLIRAGYAAPVAVAKLRAICPGAICAPEQERALQAFATRRDWIV